MPQEIKENCEQCKLVDELAPSKSWCAEHKYENTMPNPKEIKEKIIKWQKCGAHFKGKDGKGTCSSDCQWFTGRICANSQEVLKFLSPKKPK